MVRTCFVPHCKSGYKTCKEKWSIFNVPKDLEQRELWKKLIGRKDRQLNVGDFVCERHFPPEQIRRHWIKLDNNGHIICKIQLKQCRLAEGALPTIFPKGEKTPKKQLGTRIKPPRKPPKIRTPVVVTKKRKNAPKKAKNDEKTAKIDGKMPKNDEKTSKMPKMSGFEDEETKIFEKNPLLNIYLNSKLAGTNWRSVYDSSRAVLSVFWPEMRSNGILYVEKQIVVTKDLLYKIYFHNKLISDEDCCLDEENVVKDLSAVIEDMDNIRFCVGGPEEGEFVDARMEFAYVDESGVWRHRECTVQWVGEERSCVFCRRLASAISFHLNGVV